VRVVHGYGLSETTCYSCFLPIDLDAADYRHWMLECGFPSIGCPISANEMAVHDAQGCPLPPDTRGEIVIRGHNVMRCYHKRPDANRDIFAHGWFRSGDEGFYRSGPDGRPYFFITGRIKELIIRGGINYSPFDIDEVLCAIPGVRAAMAVGFENDFYGEEIGAYVQREEGATLTEDDVLRACREKLAFAKCPKVVVFGDTFPVTSTGKYQRNKLKPLFERWKGAEFRQTAAPSPCPSPVDGRGVPILLPSPAAREAWTDSATGTPLPSAGEGQGEGAGLTTTRVPFIEEAKHEGRLFIHQPYEQYSEENHRAWRLLFARQEECWRRYANEHFLRGVQSLCLDRERVPRLEDVNGFLRPLTGFQAKAVSGYIPAFLFFDCLRRRQFPTTITIRDAEHLDYLPEPDIFHDIAGHVPMHTDPAFADTPVRFGDCAHTAAERAAEVRDEAEQARRLASVIKAMARFFWFTVEFGLMRGKDGLKVYGSGLLSSHGEIAHSIESPEVQRCPIQLEWVINQSFAIDHYQPLLFVVDSFDHLFGLVDALERWMRAGKLDNVAPGEPEIREADIKSFLSKG